MTTSLHIRAEQATIGAVLHEPDLLDQLAGQLSADVWERPWHAQVWAAMMRLRDRGERPTPQAVAAQMTTMQERGEIEDRSPVAVRLAELMEAAPRTGHAGAYARMVGDAHRRRTLMTIGRRLAQVATGGDAAETVAQAAEARQALTPVREAAYTPPPRPVADQTTAEQRAEQVAALLADAEDVRARAAEADEPERTGLLAELAELMRRITAYVMEIQWRPLPANPDQQHVGARALAARTAQRRHADRQADDEAAGITPPAGDEPARTFETGGLPEEDAQVGAVAEVEAARELAERQLLAAIATAPETALPALETLDRDQWADTWRRDIATLATGLHDAGEPVDPLTLEWAARQAGLVADAPTGAQIPAAELAEALQTPFLDARAHAAEIGEAATRITVAEAAEQVLAAADDPTIEVTTSMDELDVALARVAPDQPHATAEPTPSARTDTPPAPDAPARTARTSTSTTSEAQPAPAITATTPTVPVDTAPPAAPMKPAAPVTQPAAPEPDGDDPAGRQVADEAYPSLHAGPAEEQAHIANVSAETRAVADQVFARLDRAAGEAITLTPTEYTAVLEVRGYSPAVAREAAERADLDAQRAGVAITYRATKNVPQAQASEPDTTKSVTHEVCNSGGSRRGSASRRIDPAAPPEQLAQVVLDRIRQRHGALDRDQIERVLTTHYEMPADKAADVAGRTVQLGGTAAAEKTQGLEVPKSVTPELPDSTAKTQRTQERKAQHVRAAEVGR